MTLDPNLIRHNPSNCFEIDVAKKITKSAIYGIAAVISAAATAALANLSFQVMGALAFNWSGLLGILTLDLFGN